MELGLTLGGVTDQNSTDLALGLGVKRPSSRSDGLHRNDPKRMQLDLLSWPSHETAHTGSSEGGGSSGTAAKGFDVNRIPTAIDVEADTVSSPNSVAEAAIGGELQTSSRASDEEENGFTRKKLRLSKEQSAFLEESFKEHNTLNPRQKQALARQLNLRPRQVEVWFQNRRARTKLKQTEVDCEYLKRCCETLTKENRRLHKELQELRALKSSTPYYMQRPATTLTMCPSCERTTTTNTTVSMSSSIPASTVASNPTTDLSPKGTPFPVSRTKFFPFSSHNNQPQKSVAS